MANHKKWTEFYNFIERFRKILFLVYVTFCQLFRVLEYIDA